MSFSLVRLCICVVLMVNNFEGGWICRWLKCIVLPGIGPNYTTTTVECEHWVHEGWDPGLIPSDESRPAAFESSPKAPKSRPKASENGPNAPIISRPKAPESGPKPSESSPEAPESNRSTLLPYPYSLAVGSIIFVGSLVIYLGRRYFRKETKGNQINEIHNVETNLDIPLPLPKRSHTQEQRNALNSSSAGSTNEYAYPIVPCGTRYEKSRNSSAYTYNYVYDHWLQEAKRSKP